VNTRIAFGSETTEVNTCSLYSLLSYLETSLPGSRPTFNAFNCSRPDLEKSRQLLSATFQGNMSQASSPKKHSFGVTSRTKAADFAEEGANSWVVPDNVEISLCFDPSPVAKPGLPRFGQVFERFFVIALLGINLGVGKIGLRPAFL